jgi:phosphate transport system substrate-binding protein
VVEARDGSRAVKSVEIAAHGSSTAFEDLGSGRCEVGMSSRRIQDAEATKLAALGDLTSAATEHVIALDGIAVIVNPENPIVSLTKRQIGDIFAGTLRRWSDVYWKADPIVVHARDDKSGTYDTFRHLVLEGRPLALDALRHESSEELSDAVAADPRAIGFIGLPYVRSAKAVMVQEEGSVPLLPSPVTVSTEDYPLTRRLYLYAPLGASIATHDFVDFAQSEEGQKAVEAAGFVDLLPECDVKAARCTSCSRDYQDLVAGACRLSLDFRFVRGGTQLDTRALRDLQRLSAFLARPEHSARAVVLLGFADANGTRADNLALSEQRASIVAAQLRARGLHVEVQRGLGADMPVSDNATEEGRQRNRRVEVWLR